MLPGKTHTVRILTREVDHLIMAMPDQQRLPLDLTEAPWARAGEALEVFVYTDRVGALQLTTHQPHVQLGECACLKVTQLGPAGAFLDWGLEKQLLLPFAEQRRPVEPGQNECIQVYLDNQGRLTASSRLDTRLPDTDDTLTSWQEVSLLIYQRTDLGFKAVIDHHSRGLLFADELFQTVRTGQRLQGYVKQRRPDGRIDLALQLPARATKDDLAERIADHLASHGGASPLTDKSPPETIYQTFQVSKKNYKRALSSLYKARRIRIEPQQIVLVSADDAQA